MPPNSIAVLPFVDLSEGMANEEFADGITEELIGRLKKIPGLQIKTVPVTDGRRAFGVAFVLEGSVRKSGDRVRVTAHLIRADDATVVWSESYDGSWSDILTVQDDIASKLTIALREVTGFVPVSTERAYIYAHR